MQQKPEFVTSAGKLGWRLTVSEKPTKNAPARTLHDETHEDPLLPDTPIPSPHATAGMSLCVGMSTEFARQKIEVGVWCTLPCTPDDAAIAAAYERAATIAMTEADTRLSNAVQKFFPSLADGG